MEATEMAEGIESALLELISKVEASQSLIDDLELQVQQLKLQLEAQERDYQKSISQGESISLQLQKLQEELEYYFLMSQKQSAIIKAAEELQARSIALLARVNS